MAIPSQSRRFTAHLIGLLTSSKRKSRITRSADGIQIAREYVSYNELPTSTRCANNVVGIVVIAAELFDSHLLSSRRKYLGFLGIQGHFAARALTRCAGEGMRRGQGTVSFAGGAIKRFLTLAEAGSATGREPTTGFPRRLSTLTSPPPAVTTTYNNTIR